MSSKRKRKIPDEYDILTMKLTQKLKKEVGNDLAAFLLVGSVADGNYVKGDSDCDFFLVVKGDRDKQVDILQRIGEVKAEFESDPSFSTILDLNVFFEEDLTEAGVSASSIVNWVHIWTGQNGILKIGEENPFNRLELTEEKIKRGARQMAMDYFFMMRDAFLNTSSERMPELAFYASDSAIGCAQALLFFLGERKFTRYSIPELFKEKVTISVDPKVVTDARDFRLGAKIDNIKDHLEKCYDFSWSIVKYMLEETD